MTPTHNLLAVSGAIALCFTSTLGAQVVMPAGAADASEVASVVAAYDRALRTADSATALSLLADDAVILESGGSETREQYRSHHLPSDIQFAQAVQSTRSPLRIKVRGDVAWVTSTSFVEGTFRDRPVNSVGAELMVLNRLAGSWKIAAIHWSSRTRRPPQP